MSKAARGFGSMDRDKARAIQVKGGIMAHRKGTGRRVDAIEARAVAGDTPRQLFEEADEGKDARGHKWGRAQADLPRRNEG